MGKTPPQMVTRGMTTNMGVVIWQEEGRGGVWTRRRVGGERVRALLLPLLPLPPSPSLALTAPTTYDHTPVQYMTRCHAGRSVWNSGQCSDESMIWKWPLHHRDRCWKQLRSCSGASPTARYSST